VSQSVTQINTLVAQIAPVNAQVTRRKLLDKMPGRLWINASNLSINSRAWWTFPQSMRKRRLTLTTSSGARWWLAAEFQLTTQPILPVDCSMFFRRA